MTYDLLKQRKFSPSKFKLCIYGIIIVSPRYIAKDSEGDYEVWLLNIIPMATIHQLFYIPHPQMIIDAFKKTKDYVLDTEGGREIS